MGAHLIDGEFQSDKYPSCPRGKVPLSCKDKTAQDLLWEYAQRRRAVDAEFSADLEQALRSAGYEPLEAMVVRGPVAMAFDVAALDDALRGLSLAKEMLSGMREGPDEDVARMERVEQVLAFSVVSVPLAEPIDGWWGVWRMGQGRMTDGWVYPRPLSCEDATALAARLNATSVRYFGKEGSQYLARRRIFHGQTGDKAVASGPQRSGAGDLVEGERTTAESVQGETRACQGDTTGSYETGRADPAGIPTSGSGSTTWWGLLCTPRDPELGGPRWLMADSRGQHGPWLAKESDALRKAAENTALYPSHLWEARPFVQIPSSMPRAAR